MFSSSSISSDDASSSLALGTSHRSLGRATGALACFLFEDGAIDVRFLIRDRDTKFTRIFDNVFTSIGARVIKTPVRAPQANAVAERFVKTVRTECLDWLLVRNEQQLTRVDEFVEHYNTERPHRGIGLEIPVSVAHERTPVFNLSDVRRVQRLGGLINDYSVAS